MFLFISGAVNNDNLAIPLASLGVLLLIRGVRNAERGKLNIGYWLLVGVVIGLAILTKQGTFALLPLAWGTLFIVRWQKINKKQAAKNGKLDADDRLPVTGFWKRLGRTLAGIAGLFGVVLLPVALIAGWWYWRNIQLYGDFLGWNAFIAVLGQRAQPASLAQLWDERWGFMMSFWGLFGGVNIPMSTWIYHVLNGVVVAGGGGVCHLCWCKRLEIGDWRLKSRQSPVSSLHYPGFCGKILSAGGAAALYRGGGVWAGAVGDDDLVQSRGGWCLRRCRRCACCWWWGWWAGCRSELASGWWVWWLV